MLQCQQKKYSKKFKTKKYSEAKNYYNKGIETSEIVKKTRMRSFRSFINFFLHLNLEFLIEEIMRFVFILYCFYFFNLTVFANEKQLS